MDDEKLGESFVSFNNFPFDDWFFIKNSGKKLGKLKIKAQPAPFKSFEKSADKSQSKIPTQKIEIPIDKIEAPIQRIQTPIQKIETPIQKIETSIQKPEIPKKIRAKLDLSDQEVNRIAGIMKKKYN